MKSKIIISLITGVAALSFANAASIPKQNTEPQLPPVIYATPGVEMNVYFTNIVLYKNLKELKFQVKCKAGTTNNDRWSLNSTKKQTGSFPFAITVTKQGKKVGSAKSKLVITPANAGKGKKIKLLIVGDSLTHNSIYSTRIAKLLSKPGNPQWKMLGTHKYNKKTGVVHEGYGGWTWNRFATHYEPNPNGTYKKMSSPFIFLNKSGKPYLDFARYIKERCKGEKPDYITILLGINDCFTGSRNPDKIAEEKYNKMFKNADVLLKEFRKVCPKATIGVCITPPGNSRQEAFLANYRGKYNRDPWKIVQFELDKRIIEKFANREKENIYLIPVELNLDIIEGFPERNAVHPNRAGYNQIGDSMYSWLKAMLNR